MFKKILPFMAMGSLLNNDATAKKPDINKNTGVIKLSSLFPVISKQTHRNGRRYNRDCRFPVKVLGVK